MSDPTELLLIACAEATFGITWKG